jgi:hypothetical protein
MIADNIAGFFRPPEHIFRKELAAKIIKRHRAEKCSSSEGRYVS